MIVYAWNVSDYKLYKYIVHNKTPNAIFNFVLFPVSECFVCKKPTKITIRFIISFGKLKLFFMNGNISFHKLNSQINLQVFNKMCSINYISLYLDKISKITQNMNCFQMKSIITWCILFKCKLSGNAWLKHHSKRIILRYLRWLHKTHLPSDSMAKFAI